MGRVERWMGATARWMGATARWMGRVERWMGRVERWMGRVERWMGERKMREVDKCEHRYAGVSERGRGGARLCGAVVAVEVRARG
jgi:hypothetical protein